MNASSAYSEEEIAAYARLYEGNLIPMYATGEFIVHRSELGSSVHAILVFYMHVQLANYTFPNMNSRGPRMGIL